MVVNTGSVGQDCTAIFAGSGILPRLLVEKFEQDNSAYQIVQMAGVNLDWLAGRDVISARLEELGGLFETLHRLNCTQVIFAGGVDRPNIDPALFDEGFKKLAPLLIPNLEKGDDFVLKMIAGFFESEGFRIIGAHSILSELLVPCGLLTLNEPSPSEMKNLSQAVHVVAELGENDIGQAAVVANGRCLALETRLGTDAMLRAVADKRSAVDGDVSLPQGVLVKAPKPQQDRRMDLPTIGPETVHNAKLAGLAGIGVQAHGVLVLEKDRVIKLANELGVFILSYDETTIDPIQ